MIQLKGWILAMMLGPILVSTESATQEYAPSAEYASLLSIGFTNQNGSFMVDKLQLVFPPAEEQPVEFVISKPNAKSVVKLPMRLERWNGFPAFAGLRAPSGHPGIVRVEEAGDYLMTIKVGGKAVTSMPFTMKIETGGDPFNPRKTYIREGPWSSLGFLGARVEKPDTPLLFYWWSCNRELPNDLKSAGCTAHLMQNGKVIARSKSINVSGSKWRFLRVEFSQKRSTGEYSFTKSMLCENDGDYQVVIKVKDDIVKSFNAQVKDGVLQRLPRCNLDTNPHVDFISPRLIDMRDGYGGRNFMVDAYWITTGEE